MTEPRQRRATLLLGVAMVAGCGSPAAPTPSTVVATAAPPAATVAPTPTEAGPVVIEDAGVDVALAPGRYVSRVFQPSVELQLPEGWLRRNATHPDALVIGAAAADVTFAIVHLDFAQCGDTLLEHPDAAQATDLVAGATLLDPTLGEATVNGQAVHGIDLPGDGAGSGGDIDPANGCILTTGPAPYPAEAGWVVLTTAEAARLAFVDVGGVTLLLIGRSPTTSLDDVLEAVEPLLAGVSFP